MYYTTSYFISHTMVQLFDVVFISCYMAPIIKWLVGLDCDISWLLLITLITRQAGNGLGALLSCVAPNTETALLP
eukprot:UN21489